jgi:replicative DNA helicase
MATPEYFPDADSGIELIKAPPHSIEIEKAILGIILQDNSAMAEASDRINVEEFYLLSHQRIFSAMQSLFLIDSPIDAILIGECLRNEGTLESTGGISYISSLTYGIPLSFADGLTRYLNILHEKFLLRKLRYTLNEVNCDIEDTDESTQTVLENTAKIFMDLADQAPTEPISIVGVSIDTILKQAKYNSGRGVVISGLLTGLVDVDQILGGMQKQDLIIVAARPSMGKSSMGFNIAENIAVGTQSVVVVFSLEMSKDQVALRLLCSRARVDSMRLKSGLLSKEEWAALDLAALELATAQIIVFDDPAISPMGIHARCKRVASRYGRLDLIVVDYLQLMMTNKRVESRQQEVTQISRELKALFKILNVPGIVMSQLNRKPEDRPNKRPQLADLRESGAIEQDADVVIFLYRDIYYQRMTNSSDLRDENIAEVILAKSRNGGTGVARVRYEERITRFENLIQ